MFFARWSEAIVEWMTEFQQVARIATWWPWNKQVVSEVTSWNETFFCTLKRKKNIVWWNKLKWLLNVFHHNMKLYCLGMGIKELSLKGSGSVWWCNKSNKVLQHSPVLLNLYHKMSLDQGATGFKVNECVADTRWLECSIIWFCMKQNVELKLTSGSDHWISIWILWF